VVWTLLKSAPATDQPKIFLQEGKTMQAIMEQATIDQVTSSTSTPVMTLPTVTYDPTSNLIFATVILSPSDTHGEYIHKIPPICIPGPIGSTWAVTWTLVPLEGLSAIFGEGGVVIPDPANPGLSRPVPKDVIFSGSMILPPRSECLAQITTNVPVIDYFNYRLDISVKDTHGASLRPSAEVRFYTIDPTIALVKEPMG
jgi:hypothetical protein